MELKAVLFDLDGTLLPMDQDEFTRGYFGLLARKLAPYGYEADQLVSAVWSGTAEMVKNDGSVSNETAFWRKFAEIYGEAGLADREIIEEFYRNEFNGAKMFCGYNEQAAGTVRALKEKGFRVALATNPLFPRVATEARIRWAGLEPEEFEFFTTYENIGYCKPNTAYYAEVARRMGLDPGECLMVGNDVGEDMTARDIGMQVFLLTDCMINREARDISAFPHGDFKKLMEYIDSYGQETGS